MLCMLSVDTKCMVYQAVGVLLYAVKTWLVKQREEGTLLFKNITGYLLSFADFPA